MFNMVTFRASSIQQCLDSSKVQSRRVTCNKARYVWGRLDRHKCSADDVVCWSKKCRVTWSPHPRHASQNYAINDDYVIPKHWRHVAWVPSKCFVVVDMQFVLLIAYFTFWWTHGSNILSLLLWIKILTQIQSTNENELKWEDSLFKTHIMKCVSFMALVECKNGFYLHSDAFPII